MTHLFAALPSPEYLGTAAGAIVAGVLGGLGVGYGLWRKRKTDSDIESFRRMEEAQKGTSLRTIQELTDRLGLLSDQVIAIERRIAIAEREEADAKAEADRLRVLLNDVIRFNLEKLGFLGGTVAAPPVPEAAPPVPEAPSEPRVSEGADRRG